MVKSVFLVLSAMAIAVAACSGSTTSSNSTVTAAQACTDLAGSLCDKIGTCAPAFLQLLYGDAATCKARAKLTCPATLSAPGSATKPSDDEACSQAYATTSCADLIGNNQPPAACRVHGSLMAGAACADNGQCSGTSGYCNIGAGQSCGVCSTRVAAGATCMKNADCDTGLVCGMGTGSATGACVTPGAAGAACDSPHPCGGGLVCAGGTCSPPAAAGAACDPMASTCPLYLSLYCGASNVCTSIKFANPGEACGLLIGTACAAAGTCKTAGLGNGTCQAAAADGAACDPTNGPSCMQPATCTNGACKISDPTSCH